MRFPFMISCIFYLFFGIYVLTVSYFYSGTALFTFSIPLLYFIFTFIAVCYLFKTMQQPLILRIIYFLLTVSIMYMSAAAAGYGDLLARVLFNTTSMLSLSLLVHFLTSYYATMRIRWPYFHSVVFMYSFPVILFLLSMIAFIAPSFHQFVSWVTLLFFANGLLTIFYILIKGYIQSRKKQLFLLMGSCILPFLPYVFLYALPQVVLQEPLVSANSASVFFMLLPFSFLFTQLTERLFGIHYYITRFRYYGIIAVVSAAGITSIQTLLLKPRPVITALFFICTAVVIYFTLSLKETLDFKNRNVLFSAHSNTGQSLYSTIAKISSAKSKDELFQFLQGEIKKKLQFQYVSIVEQSELAPYVVTKRNEQFLLLFYPTEKRTVAIGSTKQRIALQHEEIIWLELVAMYADAFLHNLLKIEQLYEEISKQTEQLPWLQKLVFQFVEQEKALLAQELHDSTLQDMLFIARRLEQNDDQVLREQMLDVVYELREYCESLSPPLLATLGLEAALQKLVKKVNLRATFHVNQKLQLGQIDDETFALMIYRVVQELYNNAIKHSDASVVQLFVQADQQQFTIRYTDDNRNIAGQTLIPSMGLTGMQQRVQAFNGSMHISTEQQLTIVLTNEEEANESISR